MQLQRLGINNEWRRSSCQWMRGWSWGSLCAHVISRTFGFETSKSMVPFWLNLHTICCQPLNKEEKHGWMVWQNHPAWATVRPLGNRCGRHRCQQRSVCFYGGSRNTLYRTKMSKLIGTCLILTCAGSVGRPTLGDTPWLSAPCKDVHGL